MTRKLNRSQIRKLLLREMRRLDELTPFATSDFSRSREGDNPFEDADEESLKKAMDYFEAGEYDFDIDDVDTDIYEPETEDDYHGSISWMRDQDDAEQQEEFDRYHEEDQETEEEVMMFKRMREMRGMDVTDYGPLASSRKSLAALTAYQMKVLKGLSGKGSVEIVDDEEDV